MWRRYRLGHRECARLTSLGRLGRRQEREWQRSKMLVVVESCNRTDYQPSRISKNEKEVVEVSRQSTTHSRPPRSKAAKQ